MKSFPEIRADDVLQLDSSVTSNQRKAMRGFDLYTLFLSSDRLFEHHSYKCTLAVVAEGVAAYPEWVQHIKKNKHRYVIQLHGLRHVNYAFMEATQMRHELSEGKKILEETFETSVTTFYPPWGRKGEHEQGESICKELGMEQFKQIGKVDAKLWLKDNSYPHVNFHYWHEGQVNTIKNILCQHTDEHLNVG